MHFRSYVSHVDPQSLAWARLVHAGYSAFAPGVAAALHLDRGLARPAAGGVCPAQDGGLDYFQGFEAVNEYRQQGGALRTGKVAIKIPQGADFEAALLRQIVVEYLGMA